MVREFTENEVKPTAEQTVQRSTRQKRSIVRIRQSWVCGHRKNMAEQADVLSAAIAVEELSKYCASTGDIVATHNGLCCDPIMANGTEEQKSKNIFRCRLARPPCRRIRSDRTKCRFWCIERTDCCQTGEINTCSRFKIFIKRLCRRYFRSICHDDKSKGNHESKLFIVGSAISGILCWKLRSKDGLHGSPTAEIVFQDCIVRKKTFLGQGSAVGFKIAMQTLDGGRISIAAQAR